MQHVGCRLQPALRAGQRLEEVGPERPFVRLADRLNRGQNGRTSRDTCADKSSGGSASSTILSHAGSHIGPPISARLMSIGVGGAGFMAACGSGAGADRRRLLHPPIAVQR